MYQSFFSRGISKPYPYRWFTPVTLVGAAVAVVVFSTVNIFATGYELVSVYTSNPNQTRYMRGTGDTLAKMFDNRAEPQCEPVTLNTWDRFRSANLALPYTITDITDVSDQALSQLIYLNYNFTNCTIDRLDLLFESKDRSALQIHDTPTSVEVRGISRCNVNAAQGPVTVQLFTSYTSTYDGSEKRSTRSWPNRNATDKASLLWGEALVRSWWDRTSQDADDNGINKGWIGFFPNGSVQDMDSEHFMNVLCFFLSNQSASNAAENCDGPQAKAVMYSADRLAKVFYSAILTDLGQNEAVPNILTNETLLEIYSDTLTIDSQSSGNLPIKPFTSSTTSRNLTASLPATISMQYSCQTFQKKDTGSIFFTTLVANVAFLSFLWGIFSFAVSTALERRHPEANYCEGHYQQISCTSIEKATPPTLSEKVGSQRSSPLFQSAYSRLPSAATY